MLRSRTKWVLKPAADQEHLSTLTNQLGVSPLLAQMLHVRGVRTMEQAHHFLYATLDELHDPFLLKGMDRAVPRIQQAIANGEQIRVYGDYDADGISSTSLMIGLLKQLAANFDTYIPHRMFEGYGLNMAAIEAAHAAGVTLLITVDTGISAVEQIAHANSLGIDVIVTDHHEPPAILPAAYTLINPKLPDCPYPFKGLAGVGVAFKLAHALLGRIPVELLEFVTLGTVADLMPLTDENRIMVKYGLERMRQSSNVGIRALFETANIPLAQVGSTQVAFAMAPRINASGRLEHAQLAVDLLTTDDSALATELAEHLDALNRARQDLVEEIVQDAAKQLEEKIARSLDGRVPSVIILAGEGWNVGVIGIVASKILERHYRPTMILGIDPETGKCKGSARSIPGYDMYDALTDCADLLDHYGGHTAAAGLTVHRDQLPALEERMQQLADEWLTPAHYKQSTDVDVEVQMQDANLDFIESLAQLEPFGMANPSPSIMLRGISMKEYRQIGQEKQHLKLTLAEGRNELDAIAFQRAKLAPLITRHAAIDVLGELQINEWNGRRKAQLLVQDLAVPHVQCHDYRGHQQIAGYLDGWQQLQERLDPHQSEFAMRQGLVASEQYWRSSPLTRALDYNKFSLWIYADDSGIHPLDAIYSQWEPYQAHQLTSLFIVDVPHSMHVLDDLLSSLNELEAVHLLYAEAQATHERFILPTREHFKQVYVEFKKAQAWSTSRADQAYLSQLRSYLSLPTRTFEGIIAVFAELGFIVQEGDTFMIHNQPQKADLTSAVAYQAMERLLQVEQQLVYASSEQLSKRFQQHRIKNEQ